MRRVAAERLLEAPRHVNRICRIRLDSEMTEPDAAAARKAKERCDRARQRPADVRIHWKLQKDDRGDDVFEAAFRAALEEYRSAYIARAMLHGASPAVAEAAWEANRVGLDEEE
jgi:hypothetical protein